MRPVTLGPDWMAICLLCGPSRALSSLYTRVMDGGKEYIYTSRSSLCMHQLLSNSLLLFLALHAQLSSFSYVTDVSPLTTFMSRMYIYIFVWYVSANAINHQLKQKRLLAINHEIKNNQIHLTNNIVEYIILFYYTKTHAINKPMKNYKCMALIDKL